MLVWGTYVLFKRDIVEGPCQCLRCGEYHQRVQSYSGWRFFHLYFIPLIPLGHKRLAMTCPKDDLAIGLSLKQKHLQPVFDKARQFAREAKTFDELIERVSHMIHLADFTGVDEILDEWARTDPIGAEIGRGLSTQFHGDTDEAESHLRKAVSLDGANGLARFHLGQFLFETERDEEAVSELRQARALDPQLDVRGAMFTALADRELRRDWHKVFSLSEELFRLDPSLTEHGPLVELSEKAGKKIDQASQFATYSP